MLYNLPYTYLVVIKNCIERGSVSVEKIFVSVGVIVLGSQFDVSEESVRKAKKSAAKCFVF